MSQFIYADNAATTKLDQNAFEAMRPFLLEEFGNVSQPYSFSRTTREALIDARGTIAECIGSLPEEIYFTSGGTESDNWAIKGSVLGEEKKGAIITSLTEHHAVMQSCKEMERLNYSVKYIPADSFGLVHLENFSKELTEDTRLVSIILANNEIGSIQDVALLASLSHKVGAVFHTDAVQAVGHIPIDVKDLGVDMLSASAHKFNGPKGIGFLFVKSGTPIHPLFNGGKQEFGMRAGTENVASIVGMATALHDNTKQIAEVSNRLGTFEELIVGTLRANDIDFIRNGSENHIPGNISLSFRGKDGEAILHRLDLMGICVSTGAACDGKTNQISHVLLAIGLDDDYAKGTIRISLGKSNTEQDAQDIANALLKILQN